MSGSALIVRLSCRNPRILIFPEVLGLFLGGQGRRILIDGAVLGGGAGIVGGIGRPFLCSGRLKRAIFMRMIGLISQKEDEICLLVL